MTSKPNLFIIGAAKSGTTSLHHYLAGHPEVYMSEPKEPGYFAEGIDYYPDDRQWYLGLFEEGAAAVYRGESSTHYTKLPKYPGVAGRIADFCDAPRLIYLMRDPVDRAISHYWHNTRQNVEFRPPLRAIENNEEYRAFGDYERQLEPYLEHFDRDAIFIETFEGLVSEPDEVTHAIFRWLGLDPGRATLGFPAKNAKPDEIDRFEGGQRLGDFLHRSEIWDRLSPLVPQSLKDLGKKATRNKLDPNDYPMDDVRKRLRPWARDVAERTSRLLGRDFPEWSTTKNTV